MPQAAAQKHNHYVQAGSGRSPSAAPQGDVQIAGKEPGQGLVPPLPEFGNGQCAVGLVEIGGEFKIHHFSQAQRHVTVAAEVEINLEGIGQHDQSRADRAQSGDIPEAPVRRLAEGVGNQHLFRQAQGKKEHTRGEILPLKAFPVLLQKLGNQLIMGHNGACDELRKIGNIGSILQEAVVTRLPPVGVNHIGYLLEGKEADAQGQHNVLQWDLSREQNVDVADKKVEIFVVEQDSEIHQQGCRQFRLPCPLPVRHPHQSGNAVIEQDGRDNNRQIAGVKVAVKPQGHSQQKRHRQRIPVKAVQSKVANQAKGQEQKDKNIGIKEQIALSSL